MASRGGQPGRPILIAHRGYALHYPENTIPALQAALDAGVAAVEFDVQMTADLVPVVLHDASLKRTAGRDASVLEMPLAELRRVEVNEAERLGGRFRGVGVPTVREAAELLARWPDALAFAEMKRASLKKLGAAACLPRLLDALAPVADRCVVISYDAGALAEARRCGAREIGWVIEGCTAGILRQAEALGPQYLICDHKLLPPRREPLWPGPWRWVVYEVNEPALALALAARGVAFVETRAVAEMLADQRLRGGVDRRG